MGMKKIMQPAESCMKDLPNQKPRNEKIKKREEECPICKSKEGELIEEYFSCDDCGYNKTWGPLYCKARDRTFFQED